MKYNSLNLLGSTGSIGTQTLDVLRMFKNQIKLVGISAAGNNLELLIQQVREFQPSYVHIHQLEKANEFRRKVESFWNGHLLWGDEGLVELAKDAPADLVMVATVGWTGLAPTIAAIRSGKDIALANKEVLVCGGHLVMSEVREHGTNLIPVDSEHNAIHQCLSASPDSPVRRLLLTCSGGPFLKSSYQAIQEATAEQTLDHPTWDMGAKITVDSSTLMNKGFEVIEAHHLFQIPYEKIQVVIHPQSTIHSMAEFVDGSILAQLGQTDMRLPIQYALTWPRRYPTTTKPLDFAKLRCLDFEEPDLERFPCLGLAYEAGQAGGSVPCALNAANEVAVAAHLDGRIRNGSIYKVLQEVLKKHEKITSPTLHQLEEVDSSTRQEAEKVLSKVSV